MLQSQKIISCLLCIAVILGAMVTFTCFAIEGETSSGGEGGDTSSAVEGTSSVESTPEGEVSSEEGGENSEDVESEIIEESSEESIVEASSEQSTGNNYYYAGDVSYPPYDGSRVLKNPNVIEDESDSEEKKKTEDKNINDWSYVARRWIFLPIIFTLLSLGGLIGFNAYVKKQNGKKGRKTTQNKDANSNNRNFERPKH